MNNYNLESLYSKINKHILLAEGYSEYDGLAWIIKSCRLIPNDKLILNKVILHKKWVDEFNNSIFLDKKPSIILNDLDINTKSVVDLYFGLQIDKILKISKLMYICYGQDDDDYSKMYYIAFLGIDNYLRCFLNTYNKWERVSPLLLGLKHLGNIYKNIDARYFKEFSNKEKMPFPCISGKAWLSYVPVSVELSKFMEREHDAISLIINKGT